MTNLDLALTVMSAVIGGVVLFAAFWYPIERRQQRERALLEGGDFPSADAVRNWARR